MVDHECTVKLDDSLHKAHEISAAVQQLQRQTDENDRRYQREARAHAQTKERSKVLEEDHSRLKQTIEREKQEHHMSRSRMAEIERFHSKSEAALKAMRDDLAAVRSQNEALQSEMEVQRKAFVVNVNWSSLHGELKGKHDAVVRDHEQLHSQYVQTQIAMEQAINQQEECKAARSQVLEAVDRAREDLQKGEELLKVAALSEEISAQLGEVDGLKGKLLAMEELRKRQREKARLAMEKSLMANDSTLLGTVFNAWERVQKELKLANAKKDQNKAVAMRGIANSNAAIQDFCLTAWAKEVEAIKQALLTHANAELKAKKGAVAATAEKARQKALAHLEKEFVNQAKGALREALGAWQQLHADRLKKEKAKAIASRSIANSGEALVKQIMQGWVQVLATAKATREKKAGGQARAMRMIANGDNALMDFCLTRWAKLTKDALATRRAKDGGHTKALRMIASSQQAMQVHIFTSWAKHKKALNDREKKMKAVERSLVSSGAALVQYILQNWRHYWEKTKKSGVTKANSMARGLKFVKNRELSVMLCAFQAWGAFRRNSRYLNLLAELDEKKNTPSEPHEDQIKNDAESIEIRKFLEGHRGKMEDMLEQLEFSGKRLEELELQIQDTDKQVARASVELADSRRKARNINEELSRVGAFLINKPKKVSSRPSSGTKGDPGHLPRIAPNTAREHRPESGGTKNSAWDAPVPYATKEAWSEA